MRQHRCSIQLSFRQEAAAFRTGKSNPLSLLAGRVGYFLPFDATMIETTSEANEIISTSDSNGVISRHHPLPS